MSKDNKKTTHVSTKHSTSEEHVETHYGDKQDLLRFRSEGLKKILQDIDTQLKDYTGTPLALIFTTDDENGTCTGVQTCIFGAGGTDDNTALANGIHAAYDSFIKIVEENGGPGGDPGQALMQLLQMLHTTKGN